LLKKTIEYEDFNGEQVREDHYFHLTKADLIEMEMSHKGGLHDYLQRIIKSEDGKAIIQEFKSLILIAYGKRSEDGRRFIKTQEMRDDFISSEAYSTLFLELCTNAEAAAEFINGIVPTGMDKDLAKLVEANNGTVVENSVPEAIPEPPLTTPTEVKVLSVAEAAAMDDDELRSGLVTGRYRIETS
jgi:hypothetical protein